MAKQKVDLDGIFEFADRRKAGDVITKAPTVVKKEKVKVEESEEESEEFDLTEEVITTKRIAKPVNGVRRVYCKSPSPYSSQQWDYIDYVDDLEIKYDFTISDNREKLGEKKSEKKIAVNYCYDFCTGEKMTIKEFFEREEEKLT